MYLFSYVCIYLVQLSILIAHPGIEPQTFALPGLHATTALPQLLLLNIYTDNLVF